MTPIFKFPIMAFFYLWVIGIHDQGDLKNTMFAAWKEACSLREHLIGKHGVLYVTFLLKWEYFLLYGCTEHWFGRISRQK